MAKPGRTEAAPKRQRKPAHPYRDYHYAKWDLRDFVKGSSFTISELARQLGISDSVIHLWMGRKITPLMAYKGLVMLIDPAAAERWEAKLTVYRGRAPSLLPRAAFELANAYDTLRTGKRVALESGGWLTFLAPTEPAADAPPSTPTAPPEPEPVAPEPIASVSIAPEPSAPSNRKLTIPTPYGDIVVELPAAEQRTDQSDDLLLTLATRLKWQRDEAYKETERVRAQLKAEQGRVIGLQQEIQRLKEEVIVYEELLAAEGTGERAAAEEAVLPMAKVTDTEVATTRERVRSKAPTLLEEFDRLPKRMARSV